MSLFDPHIYGELEFELRAPRLSRIADGPDRATCYWQSESKDRFKPGDAPPGFETLRIVEVEVTVEVEGKAYENVLQCEGFVDTDKWYVETECAKGQPEEGWDELRRYVFTRDPGHEWFTLGGQFIDDYTGQVKEGYEWIWIMDRDERQHRARGFFEVGMVFKGLLGDKPVKRRISSSPQTVSGRFIEGLTVFTSPVYQGFPPLSIGQNEGFSGHDLGNYEADLPQVTINDVLISKEPPPTDKVGAFWGPDDPPPVFLLPVSGITVTIHLPYGWKSGGMQSEQLAGKPLWLLSLTWMYQVATTPG